MLKILQGHVSNLIAAGEVVQRPSSVVKELMENAVDAGATQIKVTIKDSGRTLIQVSDNGCGMTREEAEMAFYRHATSKIEEIEDLDNLSTFGFRGEALASIAAVAQVTLRTRKADNDTGTQVKIAESQIDSVTQIATPEGSIFQIRNLFYNIPARRKFLKSDAAEYRQIISEFTRVALTSPHIHFHLNNNGNDIYNLPPSNLKIRINGLLGKELGKELAELNVDTTIVKVKGYIGKPQDARKTPGNQFFFVNGRFFRSPYFQKAVIKAYENLIKEDTIPAFFIFLEVDQSRIDINIHPSKIEVKFEDDYAIYDILHSVIRESLGKNSLMPGIDFDQQDAPEIPKVKSGYWVPPPKIDYDPLFNPFKTDNNYNTTTNDESLFKDESMVVKPILQIANSYITTTIKSGLLIINIKRAWERIMYDRYIEKLSGRTIDIQKLLFPVELKLSETQQSIVDENRSFMHRYGFEIENEEGIYRLLGVPQSFSYELEEIDKLVDTLIDMFPSVKDEVTDSAKHRIAISLAGTYANLKNQTLNNMEARALVDALFACEEPTISPLGSKIVHTLTIDEINEIFII